MIFSKTRRRPLLQILALSLCCFLIAALCLFPSTSLATDNIQNSENIDTKLWHEETQQVIAERFLQQQQQLEMLNSMDPKLREQMETLASRIEETLSHFAKHEPPLLVQASPKNPVILVPGIGGSTLFANLTKLRRQVWVTLLSADANMKNYMWAEYDPHSKESRSLNPEALLHTPADNHGLDAIHNLDPSLVWPLSSLTDYFGSMIKVMTKTYGFVPGSTLFGFPFDWRQSNFHKQNLQSFRDLLHRISNLNNGKRIHIVSHSMGGLFLRAFIDSYPTDWEKYVEKWVSVATPYQGAAGLILQEILKGYNLGNYMVSQSVAHTLAMRCPSVLELFPNEFFNWNPAPTISYTFKGQSRITLDPSNFVLNITSALETNKIVFDGKTLAQPFRRDMWDDSVQARKKFSKAIQFPNSVEFYNIYGIGRQTPFSIQYTQSITKDDLSDLTTAKSEFTFSDGDETVPLQSALNDGIKNARSRVPVRDGHFALTVNKTVFQLTFCWLLGDCPKEVQELIAKHSQQQ